MLYVRGVGTRRWERVRGGAFGVGLSRNILEGYRFLAEQYEPGDEIFLVGVSRGAFTARSLAGLIRTCGVLRREEVRRALSDVPEIEGRLEARFNELAEIVRDNIDRTKRISDEFHDTIEKEWKAFAVSQDEQWAERDRRGADLNPRLETLEEAVARLPLQINPLYEMFEAWAKAYAETGRAWLVQSNKALDEARTAVPSDVQLSRRQRTKIEAQRQEPGDEPADPDLIT